MNQLPAIAYKYQETLDSFRTFRSVSVRLFVGVTISGLLFSALLCRLVLVTAQDRGTVHYVGIALAVLSEMIFLFFAFRVQQARYEEAIRRVNAFVASGTPATTIRQARAALLAYLFAQPPTAFLGLADTIRKSLDLSKVTKPGFSFRAEDLLHFVFNPDARNRVVSLSLALATLVTGLTLFNTEARELTLEIVVALKPQWFGLWLTGVVVLVGAYFGLTVFFSACRTVCEYVSLRSFDEQEMNPALIRYLLRDLATYHAWPGPTLVAASSACPAQLPESGQTMPALAPELDLPFTSRAA